ncbi:putative transferase YtoA [Streptomyces spiralis]|uniref:Transferase YtoA n=1 Tax=Streptomyces spiralis TaxID=66376 RepID=A0A919AIG9_9ACTN|nr:DapH/DapD/GlmU-related protein [Streptomyces spiralis]GHF09692.1 putative transferase YtoA [Streptomyces spiralis]
MGQLYSHRDASPRVAPSALLFPSAELVGDVVVGEGTVIGAGARAIGNRQNGVRIGGGVVISANAVLHAAAGSELVIEDDVVIGPGVVLIGCHIEHGTVVEAGSLVDTRSHIGADSFVSAGARVTRGCVFPPRSVLDGFPADVMGRLKAPPPRPDWVFDGRDMATLRVIDTV